MDRQPGLGGCRSDQVDDDLVTDERLSPPVLADEGKQPMLDLVPLTRAGWQMADRDRYAKLLGQLLKLASIGEHELHYCHPHRR